MYKHIKHLEKSTKYFNSPNYCYIKRLNKTGIGTLTKGIQLTEIKYIEITVVKSL